MHSSEPVSRCIKEVLKTIYLFAVNVIKLLDSEFKHKRNCNESKIYAIFQGKMYFIY
jgi:hypothetical protein